MPRYTCVCVCVCACVIAVTVVAVERKNMIRCLNFVGKVNSILNVSNPGRLSLCRLCPGERYFPRHAASRPCCILVTKVRLSLLRPVDYFA